MLFLIVGFIAFVVVSIEEYNRFNYDDDIETGILSDEKIEELQKENKREQVISYETPKLIDSLNVVYIIPVSHKTLDEQEDISGLLNAYSGSGKFEQTDSRYSTQYYGAYNNVIVYNPKDGTNKKLFEKRVNFSQIDTEYFDKEIFLLIKFSEKDTYKDGVINLEDFKSLYIYSFSENKMERIGIDGMDVYDYNFIHNSKDLVIEFGVDKNNDGRYEEYNEPTLIKKYNFESGELSDIIDQDLNSELQKMLEGTKN